MQRSDKPGRPARLHFAMLTHNALAATQRCVRSLQATVDEPFQLFVVDNASTDGTRQWLPLQAHDWLHWRLNEQNRGVPGGRNDLLQWMLPRVGPEDWIVFVDNDLEFEAGWLQAFRAAIAAHPDARVFGKVGHFVQVGQDQRVLLPAPIETSPVDVVSGGFACFVRADAAAKIGAFDERLGLFWHEDDDFCVRALQCGFGVVAVPEAAIRHHEHASGVAEHGLREGGSLRNQAYLVEKWRTSAWVDAGGFVVRQHGPYLPVPVRELLRQRIGRDAAIGRLELAQAMLLIEAMVDQPDPMSWFTQHRVPVSDCAAGLLTMQIEQARADRAQDLVASLQRVAAVLSQAGYRAAVRPILRQPAPFSSSDATHGVCDAAEFLAPDVLAIADLVGVGVLARDPGCWNRALWAGLVTCLHLQRLGVARAGSLVAVVGETTELLRRWAERHGVTLLAVGGVLPPELARCQAVVFWDEGDPDVVRDVLCEAAPAASVVFTGSVVLNGVPAPGYPQAVQLETDLLERAGLVPIAPIRMAVGDAVLEACVDRAERKDATPALCEFDGRRLLTSFVLAARRAALPREVIQPAAPRGHAAATVGVDLRTLFQADSTSRGIGHYTVQHLAAIAREAPELRFVGYVGAHGGRLPAALARCPIELRSVDDYRPADVDLVHLPDPMNGTVGYDSPLRVLRHERTTVTFHDLTPLHHYVADWPRRNREAYLDRLQQIERSQAHLLCNSQFTADDLLAHSTVQAERVTTILAGLNTNMRREALSRTQIERVLARFGIRTPFVLHVGAHDPHKNFYSVLSAFLQVRGRRPLQLVVAGAVDPGIARVAELCQARKVPDVVFTGFLPRAMLDCLYASATALLSLSRAEGFGFPLLEAMAGGCPVIASNVTSHPEVLGDVGVQVAPDDSTGAATAIEALLVDQAFAAEQRVRGLQRASLFTWDRVAQRTLSVWRRMLDGDAAAGYSASRQRTVPPARIGTSSSSPNGSDAGTGHSSRSSTMRSVLRGSP